jgi:hypothetical protein
VNCAFLKENLCINGTSLLDSLLQDNVLDSHERDKITAKDTKYEMNDQLLYYLLRTSSEQYELFLRSLQDSCHQHVHDFLVPRGEW